MKLHIFYRHYNIEGNDVQTLRGTSRPEWFDFEKCFTNLLRTIRNKNAILHVVFDETRGDVSENFIFKYKNYFELFRDKFGDDTSSFFGTWKIAKEINTEDDDLYYFLENDYLHVENWVDEIYDLYNSHSDLDYVSLYDHKDKYFCPQYDDLKSKILVTSNRHWRTAPSTCGSFVVNKKIFLEDFDIQSTTPGDHGKFIHLRNTRNRKVITPVPSLSTHCVSPYMAPVINWEEINNYN